MGPNTAGFCRALATTLRWVSMQPLGRPVVPPVKSRVSRSRAGSMLTRGGSGLAAAMASVSHTASGSSS